LCNCCKRYSSVKIGSVLRRLGCCQLFMKDSATCSLMCRHKRDRNYRSIIWREHYFLLRRG